MRERRIPPPPSLLAGAVALAIVSLIHLASSPTLLGASVTALTLCFAWLLARGIRLIWLLVVALIATEVLVGCLRADIDGWLVVDIVILLALLVPWSVSFVWRGRAESEAPALRASRAHSPAEGTRDYLYRQLARIAGWDKSATINGLLARGSFGVLAWRAGIAALLFLVPLTAAYNWDQSVGSEAVHVFANLMWLAWALMVLVFIVALILAGYQWVAPYFSWHKRMRDSKTKL